MVEADPLGCLNEKIAEVEECIFETIDEEIRQFHDWCKDFVLEMSQRIESLAKKHLRFAKQRLTRINNNRRDFQQMVQQEAY